MLINLTYLKRLAASAQAQANADNKSTFIYFAEPRDGLPFSDPDRGGWTTSQDQAEEKGHTIVKVDPNKDITWGGPPQNALEVAKDAVAARQSPTESDLDIPAPSPLPEINPSPQASDGQEMELRKFCLDIASRNHYEDGTRKAAQNFLDWLKNG